MQHRLCAFVLFALGSLVGCGPVATRAPAAAPVREDAAQITARHFDAIRHSPPQLEAFLRAMPKGADLHNHLSGAIYAEDYLEWAARDGDCVERATSTLVAPPCDAALDRPPVADALRDDALYRQLIDAWSMRDFVADSGTSGHDHFFDTFGKFHLVNKAHRGDMLARATHQAALDHAIYLELMDTLADAQIRMLVEHTPWDGDFAHAQAHLHAGMAAVLAQAKTELDTAEQRRRDELRCAGAQPDPGCAVQVRFLYQVLRGFPAPVVFAQMLAGFELAMNDARVVGINLVMPEDGYISMRDYREQMAMLDYLHGKYPRVHISLHAGELAPGLVPPDGLRFHIRAAIERGHAQRIGHGVDVMHEDHPHELLAEMARRHVLVEICPTSNRSILGIGGDDHPLPIYLAAQVPLAIATDDEGVSRSDLSREFAIAATSWNLSYGTLKTLARNSLEYAFVPGASLWQGRDGFEPVRACAAATPGAATPDPDCAAFLAGSEKARLQWQLEAQLHDFEAGIAAGR
ncbi:MAG: adenosine deaminase [Proteobacteria bacterium]|nr:adenosine deaminase [Pseudomonadota bacterium]